MNKPITNDFSWSKSRHEKFAECQRVYYLHYYKSWNGWDDAAPALTRELYLLKKLSNRFTWAGSIVHDAIRGSLMAVRHKRTLDVNRLIDRIHRVMRQDFADSRDRKYRNSRLRPQFRGLVEHEYREPVANEEWKQNWLNVEQALRWFFSSDWLARAAALKESDWLEVDMTDFEKSIFYMQGVKIFAVPDFAFLEPDGSAHIVDWKTGQAREGYDDQLLAYALYLNARYGLPVEPMKVTLVYLNEGKQLTVGIDPVAMEAFKAKFEKSTGSMKALLSNAETNTPLPESAFKMTDQLTACARCVFRRPCGREQKQT